MYEIIIAVLIGLDQIIKRWALNVLQNRESIIIIKNVFNLTYVENRGAAFGLFQNSQIVFIIVAVIASIVGIYFLRSKKYESKALKISIILIISGAIGNLIDRVTLGYVVDYFDFIFIWNYVFNLADCFIVVGTFLLCAILIMSEQKDTKQVKNDSK